MQDHTHLHPPATLDAIEAATAASGFAMASDRLTGSLLRTLAASKPGGALLELGTGSGLATAWLLDGLGPNATLDSMDNDAAIQAIAREHLGHDPRLTLHTADGDTFLPNFVASGRTFDLIFADTWPGKLRLLDEALALVDVGGLYVIDDMTIPPDWDNANFDYDHPAAIRDLISTLEARGDFQVTKLTWSTGIIIATKTA